jgi:hypothetical protein
LGSRAGAGARFDLRVSLVVLTRAPSVFRPTVLGEFHALGFDEVLCVETARPRYEASALVRSLPGLRIIDYPVPGPMNPGMLVNLAAREASGEKMLVLWDDQSLPETGLWTRIPRIWADHPVLAVVPELRDRSGRDLPSVRIPGLEKDRLKILSLGADQESVDTLFPPDYTALYDRSRFLQTGGFDPELVNPFWQRVDWGLRSLLWGESLVVTRGFRVDYRSEVPLEDQTPDASYPRFFLRNLAVRHAGDHGVLPLARFWAHARRSGLGFTEALTTFRRERGWVKTHRYRFRTDTRLLAELWGNP